MKRTISPVCACFAMTMVYLANAYILGGDPAAERDAWLCLLLAAAALTPVLLLYARITARYPGLDLPEILHRTLGGRAARALAIPCLLYALALFGMSLNCFGCFVSGELLPDTPVLVMEALIAVCALYLAFGGPGVIGRWAALVLPFTAGFILLSLLGSLPSLRPDNILPVAVSESRLARGVWHYLAFPFGEPLLLFTLLPPVRGEFRARHWLLPFFFAALLLCLAFARNTMVLGGALAGRLRYASSYADGVVDYRNFAQHIEALTSLIPAAAGIMEAAAALSFAADCMDVTARLPRRADLLLCAVVGLILARFFRPLGEQSRWWDVWTGISLSLQLAVLLCCLAAPALRRRLRRKSLERRLKKSAV